MRLSQVSRNGHGTMSRGHLVTGTKASEAKSTIDNALARMEADARTITNFIGSTPPAHRKAITPRLAALQKKLGEMAG